ncbi:MAG: DUF1266 domain-containing protein [Nannocystaceae bacterium]|nr:DUF1266 domain-containing protein [Nannocystaceae bacterium]
MIALSLWSFRGMALLAGALALSWWLWRRIRREDPLRFLAQRLEHDAGDPYRGWVQNAFLVVTGNCDYGHLPRGEAVRMLSSWWDVHGPNEHRRMLAELAESGRPDNAWDLLRFVLLMRLGVAAGYVDDAGAWAGIRPIARRLQAAYGDWPAMAHAYLLARRQARGLAADGTEDDASTQAIRDNIAHLHGGRWAQLPWSTPLGDG